MRIITDDQRKAIAKFFDDMRAGAQENFERDGCCVPVALLRTPHVQRVGLRANAFEKWMLRGRRTKHWMRSWFALRANGEAST